MWKRDRLWSLMKQHSICLPTRLMRTLILSGAPERDQYGTYRTGKHNRRRPDPPYEKNGTSPMRRDLLISRGGYPA